MRRVLGVLTALVLLAAGAVYAGLGLVPLTATGDPVAIRAAAMRYDARIERDDFGVPHIFGAHDADVAFGLGYAHSEDDFATLADVVLGVCEHLAETKGQDAAVGDYLVRLLRVWETVDAAYERDLPLEVREILEAYAAGVNHYVVEHPEVTPNAMLPVTGRDVAAGFVFRTPFFYGLDGTLKALAGDTLIMIVEWDRTGKLSSRSIHQFGEATLDVTSPHYADQAPLFVSMRTKPVLFTRAQLAGHVKRDYRPGRPAPAPPP